MGGNIHMNNVTISFQTKFFERTICRGGQRGCSHRPWFKTTRTTRIHQTYMKCDISRRVWNTLNLRRYSIQRKARMRRAKVNSKGCNRDDFQGEKTGLIQIMSTGTPSCCYLQTTSPNAELLILDYYNSKLWSAVLCAISQMEGAPHQRNTWSACPPIARFSPDPKFLNVRKCRKIDLKFRQHQSVSYNIDCWWKCRRFEGAANMAASDVIEYQASRLPSNWKFGYQWYPIYHQ